jgi:hypothetical protein
MMSRFYIRFPLFPCSVFPLLGSGTRCRPPLVYDALLRSCRNILLAALADLCLLLISLFSCNNRFFC